MPRDEDTPAGATPYGWTCPVCEATRVGIAGPDEHWLSKGVEGLRTHIRVQAAGGHGPEGTVPARFAVEDLSQYVERRHDI